MDINTVMLMVMHTKPLCMLMVMHTKPLCIQAFPTNLHQSLNLHQSPNQHHCTNPVNVKTRKENPGNIIAKYFTDTK